MSTAVSKTTWVNLYKQLQKEANKFPQYNYRSFFKRRIRDHFERNTAVTDPVQQQKLYQEALSNLESIRRQATLSQLYPYQKTIVEDKISKLIMRECKKCKSNEYTNKNLVMMINECGHPLCKNCVDNLFARNSGNCHICNRLLKKNGYREQIFDDPLIDKETHIRKKMRKIYNLKADDFSTLREFHDYQERVETLVYNLVFETNVPETNAEIHEFEEANKERIEKNRRRLDEDQKWIEDNLRDERAMKIRVSEAGNQDSKEKENNSAMADTKAIMNELRESNVAAEVILDRERKKQIEKELEEKEEQEKRKQRHKEILQDRKRCADNMSFNGTMRIAGRPYNHQPLDLQFNGPPMPTLNQIENMGYLNHMRPASLGRVAGGYTPSMGCVRALFESRVDLLSF